ncbi:MAG TPA: 2OG-Fe(II) oxygenase [Thermoleophilaceae bacterium]|nr:2OG-Fe(II) oxygenase [Thermoleophilaceae bacterium]
MITLDRPPGGSVVASGDGTDAAAVRRHFEEHDWALVPGLLGPRLLGEVSSALERAEFELRADSMGGELKLDATDPIVARLLFVVNDPAVYRMVEAATGIDSLARFDGRIYRRTPEVAHYHVWHDDVAGDTRLVAMSVNLGDAPFEGGDFLLRAKGAAGEPAPVHNAGPGDALLFRVRSDLEHRMTDVTAGTKTAFVGWFGAKPPWPLPHGSMIAP